jgi:asparagine synthase (glutamine-hydrolysing)
MCGIAGILSLNQKVDSSSIQKMIATLNHRGPDGEGVWLDKTNQIALGHKRLSILDLSEQGKQPMHYANSRYTITFNGEIYNYLELKKMLTLKGYSFQSHTDTEVLLALYDFKKEKALTDLEGMFAFAIWDSKEKSLFCARDRFGEKPFYYHKNSSFFAFASEMKALFTLNISRSKNQKKIFDYLHYGTLEDPFQKSSTFYEDILQLEPAHYLTLSADNNLSIKQYWDLRTDERSNLSENEAIIRFKELLTSSISRRLRSDVPVGSSLSGGLDSSSIVMLIDQMKSHGQIQKTFSARFNNFSKDEGEYMKMVIDKTNVEPHFVFPTVESVINNLQTITKYQEEPIASASVAIQYEVMNLAKQNGIKVLLDGQGADEALAGYNIFWATYFNKLYSSDRKTFRDQTKKYYQLHQYLPYQNNYEFKWRSLHGNSYKAISDIQRALRSPQSSFYNGIDASLVASYKNHPNPIPKPGSTKEHLYFYLMKNGLSPLLRYADRNAMANSVEVRLPFLDHNIVEFLFTLPDNMLLRNGWTKYILRKSMETILPEKITWRKDKIGFEPPQDEWMATNSFKDYLNEAILHLKKEKIIAKEDYSLTWNYISLYLFEQNR